MVIRTGKDIKRVTVYLEDLEKNEERKLADQETKLGSKTEQDSTHMRGRARICVLLIPQPTP
ncbi:hypothetical protein PIB30_072668, partial [Stylosanthes scabra]|nr:hypothetical protein [Stylosanthes scabra]